MWPLLKGMSEHLMSPNSPHAGFGDPNRITRILEIINLPLPRNRPE